MSRVFFLSHFRAMDDVSIQILRNEIILLADGGSPLEFWFTICLSKEEEQLIQIIRGIKEQHPEFQIDIVAVIDPLKYEQLAWDNFDEVRAGFPSGTVARIEYTPSIEGKSEANPRRFVEHHRKVERWVASQCDYVFAFYYDGIPDYINTEVKRLKKKDTPKVVTINNPDVSKCINDYIDAMDGRDGIVVRGIRDGRTYSSLGMELGISGHRVQQISHRATRRMFKDIRESIT